MSSERTIKANWNYADRFDTFGLYLLSMSAQRDWIVRHDLSIDLTSSVYAVQRYDADIDRDRVEDRLPLGLVRPRDKLIWLPVLRIPSIRPADQRVTAASRSLTRGVPLMPQAQVRNLLGAGLSWLIVNRTPALQHASSTEQALVRNGLRQCLRAYLATGDPDLARLRSDQRSAGLDWDWVERLFNHNTDFGEDVYSAGVAECIAYAGLGYLAVVGVDKEDPGPHISLELLPAELELETYAGLQDARQLLGFEPSEPGDSRMARRRYWYLPKVAFSRVTSPSLYHLEIPVPEIGDLEGVHVQITTPEDVCVSPAVLHHDQRTARGDDGPGQVMQSRKRHDRLIPSPLEVLHHSLDSDHAKLAEEPNRKLLIGELDPIATAWHRRILRVATVERLVEPTPRRRLVTRMFPPAARWIATPDDGAEADRPPVEVASSPAAARARAAVADSTTTILRQTGELSDGTGELIAALDRPSEPVEAGRRIAELIGKERAIPHIEMTADDDLRDHVAHFHVNTTESVFQRTTDSRPVVNAIVRASEQGRKGYIAVAGFSCLTSTLLLFLLLLLARVDATALNSEAMVALLLLVPGVSVSLVGRVPGDSMRQLVLGRAQRLSGWSLVPPVVTASFLAVLFGTGDRSSVELPFLPAGSFALTISGLLLATFIASLGITMAVWWNAWGHRSGFNFDAQVLGRLTYRDEAEATLGIRPGHGEVTTATVDSGRVAELTAPALFQISRPHQRFMVVVTMNQDAPNAFQHALNVLEGLSEELGGVTTGGPTHERIPATVESSLVSSVATTGMTMSVVSHDLSRGVDPIPVRRIQRIVHEGLARELEAFDVDVIEIEKDTEYFRYRAVEYRHYSITGWDQHHGRRRLTEAERGELLEQLFDLEQPRRRIAYLYCPVRPAPAGGNGVAPHTPTDGAIRIGFAVSPDWSDDDDNLSLLLTDVADRCHAAVSDIRTVADEPGIGRHYDWAGRSPTGAGPHMLLSAGPDRIGELRRAFEVIERQGAHFEGGTVLTDGGYTSRAIRVWADEATMVRIDDELGGTDRGPAGGTGWYRRGSEITDVVADHVAEAGERPEPSWIVAWIRWRLDVGSGGLSALLSALDTWLQDSAVEEEDWTATFANIEFLASRARGFIVSGKARWRIGIETDHPGGVEALADEIHRSLEASLQTHLAEHLVSQRRHVVVEPHEPANPMTLLPDRPRGGVDPADPADAPAGADVPPDADEVPVPAG